VVLNLWATWCGPCRRDMPMLAAAQARHPGVAFVFVNQGESADTVRRHLATEGLALDRVLLDRPSALGPALGSGGLPTTVFFDAQGRHAGAHMGLLNRAALDARVHALQAR
jgi:thiol-disulfide isomerase/thioredoxin